MAMFAGPMMGMLAGKNNFVPNMMPVQNVMDGYAMRTYENDTRAATFNTSKAGNDAVASRLLGLRSAVTDAPVTQLNREQAQQMAGMVNNPVVKAMLGSAVGPENLEAMLHGSKGDVSALAQSVNKIGYFRPDPTGGGRMRAGGLEQYTKGIYDELYEPHGNLDRLAEETRAGNADSTRRLKKAARAEQKEIITDEAASTRLMDMDDSKTRVDQLYRKYVAGGKATDHKEQAQALTKFDRALNEAGVLSDTEVTVNGLKKSAEKMATYDMHGFMAGQVGQLAEDMFQRGKLPQAIGSMSAADRVKLIQSSGRDDETMDRLAREYGHRELMKNDDYRGKTAEGQKKELESKLDTPGGFKDTLRGTFDELDKAQRGDKGAKSVNDLEQLAGMDLMAGSVDAKRSASAIKDMTGAVAAVREIFGDNGNPNAPMPALLAALDQLTQGAGSQVSGGKVETALRQMQTLAKESGVGFEQLAGLSANMGAMGDMLGVAKGTTMQSTANVLATVKTMRDTGAFSNPVFGAMSQEEAMQNVAEREMRGNASTNSMGMATLKALYEASPEKYAGSEMEAAIKAYSDPNSDGTYEDPKTGEKKNIKEVIGKGGIQAAGEMFERAGGTQSQFSTTYYDPTTKQHVRAGFGMDTQKYEAVRDINNAETSNAIYSNMQDYVKDNGGSEFAAMSEQERTQLSSDAGEALTNMIVETSDMKREDQITHMQKNIESTLTDVFKKRGHANPEAAAKEAAVAITGKDPKDQRVALDQMISGANAFYGFQTGGKALVTLNQTDAHGRAEKRGEEQRTSAAIADRKSKFGGQEAGPMQSVSDYLFELEQTGEKFTPEGLMQAITKSIPDSEVRQMYAQEMTGGFETLQNATRGASITNKEVDAIAASGDVKKIRELAGMTDKSDDKDYVKIYDKAAMQTERDKHTSAMDDDAVKKAYAKHIGGGEKLTKTQQLAELKTNEKFLAELDSTILKPGEMTLEQAVQRAKDNSVGRGRTDADNARLEDYDKIRTSFFTGDDPDKIRTGVAAAIRQFGVTGMDEDKTKKLQELILKSDDASKAELQTFLDKSMTYESEQHKQDFTKIVTTQQAGRTAYLKKAGFVPEADKQLTPTPHKPGEAPPPGAAGAAPAKKQTWLERLLGMPGTIEDTAQKKPDVALSPAEEDSPEVAALKKERAAIEEPMKADDAYMAREEAEYAADEKAVKAGDKEVSAAELADQRERIIAQRVAKKMGLSVRGTNSHLIAMHNGVITKDEQRVDGKLLDPTLLAEESEAFDAAVRDGKSPLSPEGQKMAALDEKIIGEKKKQKEQRAAAVAAANEKQLIEAHGEEPDGTTPPAAEQHVPPKPANAPATAAAANDAQHVKQATGKSHWNDNPFDDEEPAPAQKQQTAVEPDSAQKDTAPAVASADSWSTAINKKIAQFAESALGISMPDAKQTGVGVQATSRNDVAAAQTAAITSRNVPPGTGTAGGEKGITISGTLSLQGLTEAIVNGRGSQPVQAEGGGASHVVDPPRTAISNLTPTLPPRV
jgi:hypothetical protein